MLFSMDGFSMEGDCSEEDPSDEKEISFQTLQKN